MSQFEVCQQGVSVTDICFSSKSSQLCFGCDDSSFGIFNIRSKAVEVTRCDHDPNYSTKSVSYNCYDNLVCSGCSDGEVIVYSIGAEGEKLCKMVFKDKSQKSGLTTVKFSHTKRHVLASSYENGVICIWDLQTLLGGAPTDPNKVQTLRFKFQAHTNACTGLAFSPVNNLLICSAGLDNRIQFFDIVEGKEVKKIDTGVPLSAISFCADGHTIAVGTNQGGKVMIYDLKEAKKVKIELKGHDVSKKITSLQFSKPIKAPAPSIDKPAQPAAVLQKQSDLKSPPAKEPTPKEKVQASKSPSTSQRNLIPQKTTPTSKLVEPLPAKASSFVDRRLETEGSKETLPTERERVKQAFEQEQKLRILREKEEEEQKALKAVVEAKRARIEPVNDDFSSLSNHQSLRANMDSEMPNIGQMKHQIQADFEKLKQSVEKDVMADFNNLKQMFKPPDEESKRRLENVDMLDLEQLERQRDNAQQPTTLLELQQPGLTTEQKQLIETMFEEKSTEFASQVKEQFNNMHLELIRNFMQQETEVRAVLMKVAQSNRVQKMELARLKQENLELRRINF